MKQNEIKRNEASEVKRDDQAIKTHSSTKSRRKKRKKRKKRMSAGVTLFRWSLMMTALAAAIIWIGLFVSVRDTDIESVHALDRTMNNARPWLALWRWTLFAMLIGGWRVWSLYYARWAGLDQDQLNRLLAYRWRLAFWLVVIEAVLIQDLLIGWIRPVIRI